MRFKITPEILFGGALLVGGYLLLNSSEHINVLAASPVNMIYKGTGQVIPGTGIARDPRSSQNYSMASGHNHASTRYLCWKGHGAGCVPFYNKEVTAYIQVGAVQDAKQRCIVTSGGSGQTGNNCCVYSVGFTLAGTPWMEEEGPHSPSPHITKNMAPNTGSIGNIGGKTIGIKLIQWVDSGGSHLEGWVDAADDGQWKQFYKGLNVSGPAKGMQLPVITHVGMMGDTCQEVRIRCDGAWPVTLDQARSSIAEIAVPVQPIGSSVPLGVPVPGAKLPKTVPIGKPQLSMAGFDLSNNNFRTDGYSERAYMLPSHIQGIDNIKRVRIA
jgi:hypothetical protein